MYIKGDKNMSKIFKASNNNGQRIIAMYQCEAGLTLNDVYGRYSTAKLQAYNWCREKWYNTECHNYDFHICSYNSNFFTVGWSGYYNGERAIFVETHANSYIVLLDR